MRKTLHTLLAAAALFMTSHADAAILNIAATGSNTFTPNGITSSTSLVTINLGDTVIWSVTGGSHTVTSATLPSGVTGWTNQSLPYVYIPTVVGTYNYYCGVHGTSMNGLFIVVCTAGGPTTPTITSSNGSSACQGAAVMLSTTSQAGATYRWFNGGALVSGATSNSLNAITAGNYKVKVSRCSLNDSSAAFAVTINPVPTPSFTIAGGGATRTFTNTTVGTGMTFNWDFGDGQTSTAPNPPAHTYTTSGAKVVKLKATVTATTCNTTTQQTVSVSVGIATIGGSETFSIMPNPASAMITVHSASGRIPALILTDLAGRTVHAPIAINGKDQQVNVQSLPAGLYLLRLTTDNGSAVEKITVMH